VGHITCAASDPVQASVLSPFLFTNVSGFSPLPVSDALGVCHIPTAIDNGVPPCAYFVVLLQVSDATQVGHNPDPLASVRGANIVCSQHTPPRIVPHFGKVTEDSGKTSGNKER
jgi:hypothetical protein